MGLDVYLYRIDDGHTFQEVDNLNYEGSVDEHPTVRGIEIPSSKHPDCYSKIGYWRSSYNDTGINSRLRRLGLHDLGWVVDNRSDDYYIQPDWEESLRRADELLDAYDATIEKIGRRDVLTVSPNMFDPSHAEAVDSKHIALKRATAELQRHCSFGAWANRDGEFHPDGLKVVALMPGVESVFGRPRPCTYVVFEYTDPVDHYRQVLEIVKETIEYVLADDPAKYYLCWSG